MEILVLCLLGYLFVSPDPLSLAATRGAAGAARGAATGRTPSSKKRKTRGRALLAGWREGIDAARTRREAGRDLWSHGSRFGGRVAGGAVSLGRGVHGSIQARRNPDADPSSSSIPDNGAAIATPARRGWGKPVLLKRTGPAGPETGPQQVTDPAAKGSEPDPKTPDPVAPAAPVAPTTPATTATKQGVTYMSLANTELSNIDDVEKEVKAVESAMQELGDALDAVKKWAGNLPDRWAGAQWGTAGLDRAVTGIADVVGSIRMPDVMDTFAAAKAEVSKARTVGEAADAAQARGKIDGFRAA